MSSEHMDDDSEMSAELAALGIAPEDLDSMLEGLAEDTAGLAALWQPTPGFVDRVTTGAMRRIADREAALAIADLFGLPIFTTKEMMTKKDTPQ